MVNLAFNYFVFQFCKDLDYTWLKTILYTDYGLAVTPVPWNYLVDMMTKWVALLTNIF